MKIKKLDKRCQMYSKAQWYIQCEEEHKVNGGYSIYTPDWSWFTAIKKVLNQAYGDGVEATHARTNSINWRVWGPRIGPWYHEFRKPFGRHGLKKTKYPVIFLTDDSQVSFLKMSGVLDDENAAG